MSRSSPAPKEKIRLCSRNRPTTLETRMFSETPGNAGPKAADTPDRESIETPAWEAR